MLDKLENLIQKLDTYRNVEKECFGGLAFLTSREILKHYMFLTPTTKNLELMKVFQESFPEIQVIKEHKRNERFYLYELISLMHSADKTVEQIITYIKDHSIIVFLDEGYKIFEDTMKVSKELAGIRRQPIRRNRVFKDQNQAKKCRKEFNEWFTQSFSILNKDIEIKTMWYDQHSIDMTIRCFARLDLGKWKQTPLDVIYNDCDVKTIDKLLRAKKAEFKELIKEHIFLKNLKYNFETTSYYEQQYRSLRRFQITIPKVDYDEKIIEINRHPLAQKHSFTIELAKNKQYNNTISFCFLVNRISLSDVLNRTLQLIDEIRVLQES